MRRLHLQSFSFVLTLAMVAGACETIPAANDSWLRANFKPRNGEHFAPRIVRIEPSVIRFVEAGPRLREGEIVWLFVHGIGGSLDDFGELMQHAARKHRVLALDLPGFGGSVSRRSDYSINSYVQILQKFLKAGGIPKVRLICHSMGGQICLTLTLNDPQLVKSLVMIDPAGTYEQSNYIEHMASFHASLSVGKSTIKGGTTLADLSWYDSESAFRWMSPSPFVLAAIDSFKSNLRMRLPGLRIPPLIIWGEKDPIFPLENAFHLKENLEGSELHIIEGAGHTPQKSHVAKVKAWIDAYHSRNL